MLPSHVRPRAKNPEFLAPATLRSPAAPPWRPTLQPVASKLMLTTPGIGQDKQQARRWTIGAWPDLPAFVQLSCDENPTSTRGPHDNPKSLAILPAGSPLVPAVWAQAGCPSKMALTRGDPEVQVSGTPYAP